MVTAIQTKAWLRKTWGWQPCLWHGSAGWFDFD